MATRREQLIAFVQERITWPFLIAAPGATLFTAGLIVLVAPELGWIAVGFLLMMLGILTSLVTIKAWVLLGVVTQSVRAQVILHQAPQRQQAEAPESFEDQTVH